jgi:two-component system sensor histidine kinase/response regulator
VCDPGGRILVAEDNPISQLVATAMLEHLGYKVDLAADGAEAVNAATLTQYDAILMDCQIPVLDGYDATREIRSLQNASTHTPIIALTASTTESDRRRCLAAGMDGYLAKPLTLKAVAGALARWAPDGRDSALVADEVDPGNSPPAVLDGQIVRRLERLGEATGEDLLGQLSHLFLAEADAWIHELRQAVTCDDAAAVHRSAHTLGGASANLGATGLSYVCATLAAAGAAGELAGGAELLEAVEAELRRVRVALGSRVPTA